MWLLSNGFTGYERNHTDQTVSYLTLEFLLYGVIWSTGHGAFPPHPSEFLLLLVLLRAWVSMMHFPSPAGDLHQVPTWHTEKCLQNCLRHVPSLPSNMWGRYELLKVRPNIIRLNGGGSVMACQSALSCHSAEETALRYSNPVFSAHVQASWVWLLALSPKHLRFTLSLIETFFLLSVTAKGISTFSLGDTQL